MMPLADVSNDINLPTGRVQSLSATNVEHVEMTGHIVDSLLLPKVLDAILSRGGKYHIETLRLGQRQDDPSFVRIEVKADTPEKLEAILAEIHPHGAVPSQPGDCRTVPADLNGGSPMASTAPQTSARK